MRLVLDTNVVVSALLGPSAPARLLELAAEGEIDLFSSAELLAELAEVLGRADISRRLGVQRRAAPELLAFYEALVERVVAASIARTAADPDDDDVLAAAADVIVSGDKRLRNLKSFHRIPILDPAEALKRIPQRRTEPGSSEPAKP
ncbi:MAG: putative toxin-antitoxin system toxin component, PIN family [Geminicoccaceae bacterium]